MTDLTAYWVGPTTIMAARSPEEAASLFVAMVGEEWARDCGENPPLPVGDADLDERLQDDEGNTYTLREELARMTSPDLLADWE